MRQYRQEYEKLSSGEMDEDSAKFSLLPDLILMDGGLGQLKIATEVLGEMGLTIPVFGMVKDDKHRTRGLVSKDGEIGINPTSGAFRLITSLQDEVHRSAVTYHRKLRGKAMIKSELDGIKGVGEVKKAALLKYFGSVENIKNASLEKLSEAVDKRTAAAVFEYFKENDDVSS